MSSVTLFHSNGVISPAFESNLVQHVGDQYINFDSASVQKIRIVSALGAGSPLATSIKFMDIFGTEFAKY